MSNWNRYQKIVKNLDYLFEVRKVVGNSFLQIKNNHGCSGHSIGHSGHDLFTYSQ